MTLRAVKEVGKCERCNSTEYLNGHHKIPRSVDMSLSLDRENIEVLCSACHAKEHPEIAPLVAKPHVRTGVVIECHICGNPKYTKRSKATTVRFCSMKCYGISKRGIRPHWL